MTTQNDYDKLLNEYRDLQLRVSRFSYIEQQLVNTRDQLDHELVLYKRLNKFNKDALKNLSEIQFIELVAESIIDILEIEISVFYIEYLGETKNSFIHIEGKNFDNSYLEIISKDIKRLAVKSGDSIPEIFTKRIFDNYESMKLYSDGISFHFFEKDLGYSISLLGLVTSKKSPLYECLDRRHETIFGIFGQQVQNLISNRKRSEKIEQQIQTISASEIELKKLSLIATKTKNGVIISDKEGKIEWVNDSFIKSTGYTLEEIFGKKPKDFLQRKDTDSDVIRKLSDALSKKETIEVKIVNYTKEGLPYHNLIEIIPVFDDEGNHINFISLQKDITTETMFLQERNDFITKLNSLKFFYESILNHSPAKIAVFNPDYTLSYANEQLLLKDTIWIKSQGKTLEQMAEENLSERERLLNIFYNIKTSVSENRLIQFEEIKKDEKGNSKYVLNNVLPYFDEKNELKHIIVSGVNITDLKTIQNDVLNKNLELNKINGELDTFVYRVSHDLRAPLLSIKGILTLLFHAEQFNENVTEYLNLIQNSVLRLDETIQEILEYSRNARLEVKLESFNIEEMVNEIFADLKYTNPDNIDFSMNIQGSPILKSDKSRLNTVLKNIIGNSVKYKKSNSDDCFVTFSLKQLEKSIEIKVSDNGEGISSKSLPKIFEMFYRGTSTSVGTGLGLYITKEILNKLNGTIFVSSELGLGTTITINIPNK
jgi:PAS domain S-box-containing protein